jgi:hypothetical protein
MSEALRRMASTIRELTYVVLLDLAALRQLDRDAVLGLAEDLLVGDVDLAAAVAALDGGTELVRRRQLGMQSKLEDAGQRVEGLGVERVGDGDEQFDAVHLQRQDRVTLGLLAADELEELLRRRDLGHVDDLHVELRPEGLGD